MSFDNRRQCRSAERIAAIGNREECFSPSNRSSAACIPQLVVDDQGGGGIRALSDCKLFGTQVGPVTLFVLLEQGTAR